ncbi:hypothetical protein ACI6PS_04045 [Flavobacterium sp. PLA-1-15]|uniref:hypothetical protein n=1 Tax=Flavobacterium sp. PLA-1-15 TaxID=3380533 RepID=UPI003B7C351C
MVLILKKGTNKSVIQEFLKTKSNKKGFDAGAFLGKIKLKKDPLVIQKQMRDEWE